ncbi:MAG: DUF2188 domain-containing protein [Longicatena sp.]
MKKDQFVVPHDGKWAVKGVGNQKYTAITETQREAICIARNQQSELVILGADGKIRQKDSYGNDPYPPRG